MNNQKIDNTLNLVLDSTNEEIEKSPNLSVGYNPEKEKWEIIIRYVGDISYLGEENIRITELFNGYAVLELEKSQIDYVANLENVIFIEMPKRLYFAIDAARSEICINPLQNNIYNENVNLEGEGVLLGIIDSGIDYFNGDFINYEEGMNGRRAVSRIAYLWDQTIEGNPPRGYQTGSEYTNEDINRAIERGNFEEGLNIVPSMDRSGHGTAVAFIAGGNGNASGGRYIGMAPRADYIIVKLGTPRSNSFPRTSELLQGIDYIIRKSIELNKPAAINISFGNTYGSHTGTSLVERYIEQAANIWKTVICVGTGNEGNAAGHFKGKILENGYEERVQLAAGNFETGLSVQLWKNYVDEFEIILIAPNGNRLGPFQSKIRSQRFETNDTIILVYFGEPAPFSKQQEIYMDFIPKGDYIEEGIWEFRIEGIRITLGDYNMWLPSRSVLGGNTQFLLSSSEDTITIPATAGNIIAIGAVDGRNLSYADFSGRGGENTKPDIVAPGVNITAANAYGGFSSFTGTSIATPFVTGAATLLMEWGIIKGNDRYLYGEKVKAYLQKGAEKIESFDNYPNNYVGYGLLCVEDSIPD